MGPKRNPDFEFKTIPDDQRVLVEPWEMPSKGRRKADNAKVFLTRFLGSWYCQEVLAVWREGIGLLPKGKPDVDGNLVENQNLRYGLQAKKAEKEVEKPLQILLGLWGS